MNQEVQIKDINLEWYYMSNTNRTKGNNLERKVRTDLIAKTKWDKIKTSRMRI